eukprot:1894420-Rhodomonas_salina.1
MAGKLALRWRRPWIGYSERPFCSGVGGDSFRPQGHASAESEGTPMSRQHGQVGMLRDLTEQDHRNDSGSIPTQHPQNRVNDAAGTLTEANNNP